MKKKVIEFFGACFCVYRFRCLLHCYVLGRKMGC